MNKLFRCVYLNSIHSLITFIFRDLENDRKCLSKNQKATFFYENENKGHKAKTRRKFCLQLAVTRNVIAFRKY